MDPSQDRNCWLMKAEPETRIVKGIDVKFSATDFETVGTTAWEGVRNHQAKVSAATRRVVSEESEVERAGFGPVEIDERIGDRISSRRRYKSATKYYSTHPTRKVASFSSPSASY